MLIGNSRLFGWLYIVGVMEFDSTYTVVHTLAILAVFLDGYRSTHKENKVTLTGHLSSSSSQNSLPESEVAGSSQNPMPGGAAFSSYAAEGTPRSDLACVDVAGFLVIIGES